MNSNPHEHRRWQFEMLMELHEQQNEKELRELFSKLLLDRREVMDPLCEFIALNQDSPRISILIKLLGKMREQAATPILTGFLNCKHRENRLQAIIALGWLRARAGLEILDEIEARDSDEEIKREAGIAIEEILRDFPTLRDQLKFHQKIAIKRNPITIDSPEVIAQTTPPGGEQRWRLCGMFPRMLAMKYRAVPLGIGKGGVIGIAVNQEIVQDPSEEFAKLLGRNVDLHGWPLDKIYERILQLYRWGDNDWVLFGEHMTETARRMIASMILSTIHPNEPHSPLGDCMDASEAIQSFLAICKQSSVKSVIIEYDTDDGRFDLVLIDREKERTSLGAPPPIMKDRFMKGIELLANCKESISVEGETEATIREGMIQFSSANSDVSTVAAVRSEIQGGLHVIALEIREMGNN